MVDKEYIEWAVEYEADGQTFVYEADSEADARTVRAAVDGRLMAKQVFETSWLRSPG